MTHSVFLETFRWEQYVQPGSDRERSMMVWSKLFPAETKHFSDTGRDLEQCEFQLQLNINSSGHTPIGELSFIEPFEQFPKGCVTGGILLSHSLFDDIWYRVRESLDIKSSVSLDASPISYLDNREWVWETKKSPKLIVTSARFVFRRT